MTLLILAEILQHLCGWPKIGRQLRADISDVKALILLRACTQLPRAAVVRGDAGEKFRLW